MNTEKTPQSPVNPFAATAARLGLTEPQASDYFGVPVFTYRKWINGTRAPNASALRLLEVLGMIEALCPTLHAALLPTLDVRDSPR
jgi:DNA-binding transcriptional regulator YiaG